MLSDLIKVEERIFQSSADGGHPTQCCAFELLALKQRLCIFEEPHIIPRNNFDQMLRSRELTKSDPEMVGIIKGIKKIFMEGVNILESWETVENEG